MQRIWYPHKIMIEPFVVQQLRTTSGCKMGCITYACLYGFEWIYMYVCACAYVYLWNIFLAFEYLLEAAAGGWNRHSKITKIIQMYISIIAFSDLASYPIF